MHQTVTLVTERHAVDGIDGQFRMYARLADRDDVVRMPCRCATGDTAMVAGRQDGRLECVVARDNAHFPAIFRVPE